jgi:hypothetical protein
MARLVLAGLLVIVAAALTGCLGPKPEVVSVQTQPPASASDPYRVHVLIANKGPGDGQVAVTLRLVDKRNGQTLHYDEQDAQLAKDEQLRMDFEEMLPADAPPADQIDVQVEAQYPIE